MADYDLGFFYYHCLSKLTRGLEFQKAVHFDKNSGRSGVTWPNGTPNYPVNSIDDAVSIANTQELIDILCTGGPYQTETFGAAADGKRFFGTGDGLGLILDLNNKVISNCLFKNLAITGQVASVESNQYVACYVYGWYGRQNAMFESCILGGTLYPYGKEYCHACAFTSGAGAAHLNFGSVWSTGEYISIVDCAGRLAIDALTDSLASIVIAGFEGEIEIAGTCTAGTITIIGGGGRLVNNTGGATVNVYGFNEVTGTGGDWTSTELANIRHALGVDGTKTAPTGGYGRLGLPVTLGSGADVGNNLKDLAGATFNNTTDSQEAIRDKLTDVETDTQDIQTKIGTPAGASVSADIATNLGAIQNIQNNTRLTSAIPSYMLVPGSGNNVYKVSVNFYDTDGNMEDPDSNDLGIKASTFDGSSKSALLYQDSAVTSPLTNSGISGYKKLVRIGTGQYECYVKIASTELADQWLFEFALDEGTVRLYYTRTTLILESVPGTVTLAASDTNRQIVAQAIKNYDSSGIAVGADSIYDDLRDYLFNRDVTSRHLGGPGDQKPKTMLVGTGTNQKTVTTTLDGNGNLDTEVLS